MINYLPLSSLSDVVGGANLYNGENYNFVADRFCRSNSAVNFKNGYLQVPPGVYFTGDFTVLAWIKLDSYGSYQRIIGFFNNDPPDDEIFMAFEILGTLHLDSVIQKKEKPLRTLSNFFELNQWYHVAYVMQNNMLT